MTERRTDRQKETGTICSVYRLAKSSHIIRGERTEVEKKRQRKKKGQAEMLKAIASFFSVRKCPLDSKQKSFMLVALDKEE